MREVMRSMNKGGYVNMRNIRSLIKNDDAMGGGSVFLCVGSIASVVGICESCRVITASLLYPAISSMIGSSGRSLCTWMANILTA